MKKSLVAIKNNDGVNAYQLEVKTINYYPYVPSYRRIFSKLNLTLAKAILSKPNVSDNDKNAASTLIKQSIKEAMAAVYVNKTDPTYWYNLAEIYGSLIGNIDNAANFSFQYYQQAITLDPVNPNYYLSLGKFMFSAKEYSSAEKYFEQAHQTTLAGNM